MVQSGIGNATGPEASRIEEMLTFALTYAILNQDPKTVDLIPTEDVWVYPHAGDPSTDSYLRAWGAGGKQWLAMATTLMSFLTAFLSGT